MALDDLFGSVGDALSPLQPAADFLLPQVDPGQGTSLGSLISSLGEGARNVVAEGPGAIATGGIEALNPFSGASAKERLMFGGLAALGAGMLGRDAYRTWKATRIPNPTSFGAPAGRVPQPLDVQPAPVGLSGAQDLVDLGDTPRTVGSAGQDTWDVLQKYPGMNGRQASLVGARDADTFAQRFGSWDPETSPESQAHFKVLFDQYAQMVGDPDMAQWDFAKFDLAIERNVFAYDNNVKLRKTWSTLRSNPEELFSFGPDGSPSGLNEEGFELLQNVKAVAEATDQAGPDLSIGVVGRIERIELTDEGPVLFVRQPEGWRPWTSTNADVRVQRLRELNYRNLADRGKEMLRTLYNLGIEDWNAPEGAARRLPEQLEVGPDWYPTARNDVADAFGYPREDGDDLSRAVAAVSFLSEAEDWSTNIDKAHRVMTHKSIQEPLAREEFLAWLKNPKAFTGKAFEGHQKVFDEIHAEFTGSGFKVSKSDLGVVLRLMGKAESVQEIFAGTARRKQKNFYLNIYHPELEYPVTIDRHAFDAFLGMDTGINDRPIDMTMSDGDQVYDVVADTYRALAAELSIPPHELQAVVWEAWRMLKQDRYRNAAGDLVARRGGWVNNDPYFLPDPGSTRNAVFDALNGYNLPVGDVTADRIPYQVLEVEADGIAAASLPDNSAVRVADVTLSTAAQSRHLYPAIEGVDRVPRWAPVRPNRVRSLTEVRRAVSYGDHGDVFLNSDLDRIGGHPLLQPGDTVVYEVPLDSPAFKGRGYRTIDMGRTEVDAPELSLERLDPNEIDPKLFTDPDRSPLVTHRFVTLSAEREGMDELTKRRANNQLRVELQRRGYKPVQVQGKYTYDDGTVGEEMSLLAFGVPADEAIELGSRFNQESVLTNEGLLYSDGSGRHTPSNGYEFGIPAEESNRSLLTVGGTQVTFVSDLDFDTTADWVPESALGRRSDVRRKVAVKMGDNSTRDIFDVAEELESKGAKGVTIYSNRAEREGWQRAFETLHTDGVQTFAHRTTNGPLNAPNGGFVFQRNVDGISASPVTVPPMIPEEVLQSTDTFTLMGGQVIPVDEGAAGDLVASVSGNKVRIESATDVMDALELKHQLAAAMPDKSFEVRVAGKKYNLPKDQTKPRTETVLLRNGLVTPRPRRDRPIPEFAERFGFDLDVAFRVGNQVEELDEVTTRRLFDVTEMIEAGYGDALRRFGLRGVSISPGHGKQYAQYSLEAQTITLSKDWWRDIPQMVDSLEKDRAAGVLARRAPATPESILVHEYGHVIHSALRAAEGWGKSSRVNDELMRLVGYGKKKDWRNQALKVSDTAASHPSELVAEAFSEVLLGERPSAVSELVVDLVDEQVTDMLKQRRIIGL